MRTFLVIGILALAVAARAVHAEGHDEQHQQAIIKSDDLSRKQPDAALKETPSTDTTPVNFSVDGVSYRVPRNYIVHMFNWNERDQNGGSPLLKVAFPGLEPLNDRTKDCLLSKPLYRPSGCVPVYFWIGGRSKIIHKQDLDTHNLFLHPRDPSTVTHGADGYKVIEMSLSKRMIYRIYWKQLDNQDFSFRCLVAEREVSLGADSTNTKSNCHKQTLTAKGGEFEYRFNLDGIADVEKIDKGLRPLVDSFTLEGDKL